jgi:hypothetical protein
MEQTPQAEPGRRLQHVGEAILVIVGAYLATSIAVTAVNPVASTLDGLVIGTNLTLVVQTVVQFLVMIVVVVWYAKVVDTARLIRAAVPSSRNLGLILGGTVVLLIGQSAINWLFQLLDLSSGSNQAVTAGAGDPTYYLLMVPISLLVVGPAEELLFRGAVQGRLRESWGPWPAIIVATVLFGLIHIPAVTGGTGAQLLYALFASLLGVVLGYLYEYTQNIVVPAVIHGVYNGTQFALLYLTEIGMVG